MSLGCRWTICAQLLNKFYCLSKIKGKIPRHFAGISPGSFPAIDIAGAMLK